MLRTIATFAATALLSTAALALTVGSPAPAFTSADTLSGKPIALADFKGKTVVLEWNNPDCPFVKKFYSVGAMQELQKTATADGVVWISINSSAPGKEGFLKEPGQAKSFVATQKAHPSYYLLDPAGTVGHAYGAKTTPHMFVIDAKGNLAYEGAIDNKPTADSADIATATNYVSEALKALKAGTPIKTATSQPYGCFVKY
ncbi:MAG: redoxin family protein [Pseudomonadota bacterium]